MMRDRVVAVRNADLRVGTVRAFATDHHGGDTSEISLKSNEQHIRHQLKVVPEIGRNAKRLLHSRDDNFAVLLCSLDLLFDLSHGSKIFVEFAAIDESERGLYSLRRLHH